MRKKNTILILIFSLVATLIAVGIFLFVLKVIKNKNQHTSVALVSLQEKIKDKENATIFASKVEEIKNLREKISEYFVNPENIDVFVSNLEEIGTNLGSTVEVKGIEIPPKVKNTIIIRLSVGGTFNEVINTVSFLESLPYQVNINQMYINKDVVEELKEGETPKAKTWQADVSFNILSL